jgi:glycogen phosphorylase
MEASGTGNMKLALNGALTIGTMDGANVEMHEQVGDENIFIFGLRADEVDIRRAKGINGRSVVESSPALMGVVNALLAGSFSQGDHDRYKPIVDSLMGNDYFLVGTDFDSYAQAQQNVSNLWLTRKRWTEKAIINSVSMGWFSSDRTIRDYARDIWKLPVN